MILCSTPRLARNLQLIHQRRQREQGQQQWQPLPVMTLAQWLQGLISEAMLCGDIRTEHVPPAELSSMQEIVLWEQAIAESMQTHDASALFDTSGLAAAAQEANRLVLEWNLSLPSESNGDEVTEETRHFLQWRQRFQSLCKVSNMLEPVRYFTWQVECIEAGAGQMPAEIQLAGFDRINPLLQRLIVAVRQRGIEVREYALTHQAEPELQHLTLDDQDAECRAAVRWASDYLKLQPEARIAIVVPELSALRNKLAALLDEAFHPQVVTAALAETSRVYDFSLGMPLARQPIIAVALDLLYLVTAQRAVSQLEFSRLLLSPYWSSSVSEADARAQLDARMRQELPLSCKPARLLHYLRQMVQGQHRLGVSVLHQHMQGLFSAFEGQPSRQLPSMWARVFRQGLLAAGWPGERSISSYEYQARQSLDKAIESLAAFDSLLGKVNCQQALQRLTQLAQAQIFQVESKTLPALQVLGMLEASAEPLHAVWVMGMNDHVWPPIARTNALIPASLQRQAGTPNASNEVQTAYAQAIHQRLLRSGRQVIFSSARRDGERELRISPLMKDIPASVVEMPQLQTLAEQLAAGANNTLEWLEDATAPAVQPGEHVAGGTGLLRAQAICPAWAFYQYRLHARALREPVDGLDVMERGSLVHAVLARFWEGRGSDSLQEMMPVELEDAVRDACISVLAAFNQAHDEVFSEIFIKLEQERLQKLVLTWLRDIEMQRPQGFTVTACELEQDVEIDGIAIKLIVDRIDTLDDGGLAVMDYKTGRALDFRNWAQVRMTEPQLPIYAAFVLQDVEVAAVCFARVRLAEHGFAGIAADDGLLQGVAGLNDKKARKIFTEDDFPDWPALVAHWRGAIHAIAAELKAGVAAVRFEDEKQLEYCEVLPLLRLPERQLQYERSEGAAHEGA